MCHQLASPHSSTVLSQDPQEPGPCLSLPCTLTLGDLLKLGPGNGGVGIVGPAWIPWANGGAVCPQQRSWVGAGQRREAPRPPSPGNPGPPLISCAAHVLPEFQISIHSGPAGFGPLRVLPLSRTGVGPTERIKGRSRIQGRGGGSWAFRRPAPETLQGSETPGDKTQTHWTETSKASVSWGRRLR